MRKEISLNEMRERVADLLYGNDWIGELTDEQYDLLRKYPLRPREIVRTDGSEAPRRSQAFQRDCPNRIAE